VESSAFRENARTLGTRVAARDGIPDAVTILEKMVAAHRK